MIRTLIICLPDELPRSALTAHQLDRHFDVFGTRSHRFWATPALYPRQRGQLIGLRKGRPAGSGATRPTGATRQSLTTARSHTSVQGV
jgi:hypothetical protein